MVRGEESVTSFGALVEQEKLPRDNELKGFFFRREEPMLPGGVGVIRLAYLKHRRGGVCRSNAAPLSE